MNEPEQPTLRVASGDELRVRRFSVKQAMNEPFTIEVVALSENGDVDFDAVIGHPAAFSLGAPDAPRGVLWTGICSEARQVRWEEGGLSTYRLVIVPRAWLLTQRRSYRIFQGKSELDIVRQVLAEAGVALACRVDAGLHAPRDYRIQYGESDFAFVSRLMEDAGISYCFETQGDQTVLVLDDAPETRAVDRAPLVFGDDPDPSVLCATELTVTQRVRAGRATLGAKQIQLRTNAVDLVPGAVTTILGHAHRAVVGQPLLVVSYTLESDGARPGARAEVTLAPTATPYRPELKTPRPKAQGLERATVVGPAGEAIHTDEQGRVRVQFHWDGEDGDADQGSCWVPSSQPWGGVFGGVNLPRIGQEVLVEFLGGDPDRPVIIGRVFTESDPPPYKLPDYKHVTGIRSEPGPRLMAGAADGAAALVKLCAGLFPGGTPYSFSEMADLVTQPGPFQAISPDGATQGRAGSELSFHDTQGEEIAYFQAQKDAHSLIKNAKTSVIGNSRACTVGTDDQLNVEHKQQIDVGNDQKVSIGGNRQWDITKDVVQNVGMNYILNAKDAIVNATDGFINHSARGEILIMSDTKITLMVGDSSITMTPDNITIQSGDRVDLNPRQGEEEQQKAKDDAKKAADKAKADRIKQLQAQIKSNQDALASGYNPESTKNQINADTTELRALKGDWGHQ